MILDDQILVLEENNIKKIIVLSGNLSPEYDDLLLAYDLKNNEYLLSWDLASYFVRNDSKMFEYWYGEIPLVELIYQTDIINNLNLQRNQEISLEQLKLVEQYLNNKERIL